jgi:DNA-binding Lrp family transcriptional regulator
MLTEILKILENDARATPEQIATMTGSTGVEVSQLIQQAESDRTILKYKTVVNWARLGEAQVWGLIEVKIAPQRDFGFDALADRVCQFPQVRTVYLVSGTYDLLVVLAGRTMHEVADFVAQELATIEGVQGTVSHFVLKRYKEDGEMLEGGDGAKREPVIL